MLLRHTRSVHTVGMRFAIDVAFLTKRPRRRRHRRRCRRTGWRFLAAGGRSVLEAEAGAFERWGLEAGDRLEIKG